MISSAVQSAFARLCALGVDGLEGVFLRALEGNPAPEAAITNLERWVHATGNPRLYLEQLLSRPAQAHSFVYLLGASQPIANSIILNPELATVIFDSNESTQPVNIEMLLSDGRRLLEHANGRAHMLDRLRYLKQRYSLPIVLGDLGGIRTQQQVWRALSDLADTLIQLTFEASWQAFASQKGLGPDPLVAVVAFGKLGGREVNYSSDVDLAYVALDGLDEATERECTRFCEGLGRALSDRMGRGSLYRVDLRLRPYGASGAILRSVSSYEGYYRLYAEPWEIQALLKSRVIAGADLGQRWSDLVQERCYQPHVSDVSLSEMLDMRKRTEAVSKGDDIKRGPGGIRDVEFLCQMMQLVHGFAHPSVRAAATCDALTALQEEHMMDSASVSALIDGYTFLRKLEHRVQLVGDLQTHSVPTDDQSRERLAKLMSMANWPQLERSLNFHRRTIHSLYHSILKTEPEQHEDREILGQIVEDHRSSLWHWFDVLPGSDAFYRSLRENRHSLTRVARILELAPSLIGSFKMSVEATEMLLSGEIEERVEFAERIAHVRKEDGPQALADAYVGGRTILSAQFVFDPSRTLGDDLAGMTDAFLVACREQTGGRYDVIALGSYGSRDMGLSSDADLVLLTERDQFQAEAASQDFIALLTSLKRFGLDLGLDLRLRPDGNRGLLVRTYDGFGSYDVNGMEMWERFALGNARLVAGNSDALDLVRRTAYAVPLRGESLDDLLAMKKRIETERVKPQHYNRDIKLGHGGLNDIEWIIHLLELRHADLLAPIGTNTMPQRIQALGRCGLLNAFEVTSVTEARGHLLRLRCWLHLQQLKDDLLPENPGKLGRLARAYGLPSANDFLRMHEPIVAWVREFFTETIERVRP